MRTLLCPLSSPGYLYPATAVALELHLRGHEVTLVADPHGAAAVAAAATGVEILDAASVADAHAFEVSRWFHAGEAQYRAVLAAARVARPDVLVTSVLCLGSLLAAETLDIPVVVLGLACHLWPFAGGSGVMGGTGAMGATGVKGGTDGRDADGDRAWRLTQTLKLYDEARRSAGLPNRRAADAADPLLGTAFLLRGHRDLEPQGAELPDAVRHVGPLWWEPPGDPRQQALTASLDRVGKRMAYVHLGRTFGGESLWPWIDVAFTGTQYQAVVELGRTEEHRAASGADVLTVRQGWMSALIERADIVVANGTSAPVLGALVHGRPLLLRPNGGEQRLLASACVRAGVAAELTGPLTESGRPWQPAERLTRTARESLLRSRGARLGGALQQTKSAALAAQEVEDACR